MSYWGPRKESAAEKRARKRVLNAAEAIAEKLKAMSSADFAKVPALFSEAGKPGDERYEVFRMLDENPGYFGDDYYFRNGYNVLRIARNSVGRELFAVINGEA